MLLLLPRRCHSTPTCAALLLLLLSVLALCCW